MNQSTSDLAAIAECILFVSSRPVPAERLATYLQISPQQVPAVIATLAERLQEGGLHVVELAGGYNLATRPQYAEVVTAFLEPDPQRMSVQALETLAIVAYRQLATRVEIDELRGVNSAHVLHSLLEKNLIRLAGRKQAPGRPFLFETTEEFLRAFGLKSLDELPRLEEFAPLQLPSALTGLDQPAADENEEDQQPSSDLSRD